MFLIRRPYTDKKLIFCLTIDFVCKKCGSMEKDLKARNEIATGGSDTAITARTKFG